MPFYVPATSVAVQGLWMPRPFEGAPAASFVSGLIDATGEKFAWIGRVWNKDRATKSIRKVHFCFGTVVKAGGSGLTLSLQNVDLANGPVYRPDGTPDQTVAIANGDAAFASNTWYTTGNLSADRSVTFGELIAVVIEYDGSGRLGADAVNIRGIPPAGAASRNLASGSALFTASWAVVNATPNVILEFTDGTFGTLDGAYPLSATASVAFNSGSAADEIALQFTPTFNGKIDGASVAMSAAAGADFDVVLYEGTTARATASFDAEVVEGSNSPRLLIAPLSEVSIAAGVTYYLSLKPTTANNVTIYYFDVAAAGHFQAHEADSTWIYNTRVDAGAWGTATATRRPFMCVRFSQITK